MAYACYLASCEWNEIENLRQGMAPSIRAYNVVVISHLLAYIVKERPLCDSVADVIDKGEVLADSFWHPLRVPIVHPPAAARSLLGNLLSALEHLSAPAKEAYMRDAEIRDVLRVLEDARANNLALVSALEPPSDQERAVKVACPFTEPQKLPIPWGDLGRM